MITELRNFFLDGFAGNGRAVLDGLPLLARDEQLTGLRALERADDAVLFHLVDETRRARIAELQPPLEHGDGRLPRLEHHLDGVVEQLPDRYTVAGKLPFEGFKLEDFKPNANGDGTFTLTSPEGVGKSTLEFKCITGVNKGVTFINEIPDANKFGRYQGTIIAEEGEKYKAGSIVVGQDTVRYTPVVEDFDYDATKNTVEYKGENYYDADPQMTLLYGTDQSETVPTAPGSYDVYVKVTAGKNYIADAYAEDYYRIYQVGTYVVPEQTKPKYCYYWNTQEGKECEVGTPITLGVDKKEGNNVIWKIEGLADDAYTITDTGTQIELQFFMPSNDVRVTNHYEPIYYTLTVDGKEERRAFGKEVTFTAPEKEGHTFTGWEVDGVPEGTDTSKATITFTMPANNVTLTPQYKKNTYTLTVDGKDEPRVFDEDVTVIAQPVEGKTFTGWKVTGLPTDVDTSKATITFKMPANKVTLKAEYTENAPKTYELKVTDAQVTLKDGGAVADLTAVPVGTELVATAPEKDGYTFTGWEVTGLPADVDTTKATISFKMPANNVTLKAQYNEIVPEKYTVTMGDEDTDYAVDADVSITAPEKDGYTFTGWDAVGVPEGTDTNSETITFKMPANNVTLTPQYKKDSTPTPAPGGDSDGGGAAIVAVAAVGGAAIGVGAYIAGTTAYLKSVLPEGMAIPANRQQLAVALWTAAGKPATQSTALFNDVAADAAELQAIRWVVETGLMSAQDGSFKPGSRVGRMEVIRTWKTYQQRG